MIVEWPCPVTLSAAERPEWAAGAPVGAHCVSDCARPHQHPTCLVEGCQCVAMLNPDEGDGEPLCEGHWLDSK